MARKRSKKPLQKIKKAIERRGTKGTFRAWCRKHGFSGGNEACARYALRQYKKGRVSASIMKKARTALAFAKARKSKRKKKRTGR